MIDRLIEAIQKTHAPICVGLDPQMSFIPEEVKEKAFREYGHTMEGAAEAIWQFNKAIVDAVYDLIPSVKPQIAMYEQYGIEGLKAFDKTVRYCQQKGLIVIGDVKRGDIGSTSAAYAAAHLGTVTIGEQERAAFGEDFCTVNPYLGSDGIVPFLKACESCRKGIFVLVKTSNPSSGEFQDQKIGKDTLYEKVGDKVEEWGEGLRHGQYSDVGAVVGATYPEMGAELRKRMPHTFILVPGYGAQGGKGKDLKGFFDKNGDGAIVNSSRGIIAAYTKQGYEKYGEEHFADASRAAVLDMKYDLRDAL